MTNASGLKRYLLIFSAGALMTLALPPLGLFPALFISIPVLMTLVGAAVSRKQAFADGWVFGCGFFIIGWHWIGIAFQAFFTLSDWLIPVAMIVIPAYCALCYAVAAWAAWHFRGKNTYPLLFALFLFWGEYFRGHFIMHFPWNLPGYAWHHLLPVLQSASLFGIYGLTFLTFLWASAPLYRRVPAFHVISFFAVLGFGVVTLQKHPTALTQNMVRIIQPNITQAEKETATDKSDIINRHLALMEKPLSSTPVYVLWPETSFDITPQRESWKYIDTAAKSLPTGSTGLIGVNILRREDGKILATNSLIALDNRGDIIGRYDKHKPAPWGERILFRNIFGGTDLYKKLESVTDISQGTGPVTVSIAGKPSFGTAICFEIVFANEIIDRKNRPDFILAPTNDAWAMATLPFPSIGPLQHFGMARVRAVEEGLPLVRSANTGISGIIDAHGRILQTIGLHEKGVIDAAIPAAAAPTLYSKTGDTALVLILSFLTVLLLVRPSFLSKK